MHYCWCRYRWQFGIYDMSVSVMTVSLELYLVIQGRVSYGEVNQTTLVPFWPHVIVTMHNDGFSVNTGI